MDGMRASVQRENHSDARSTGRIPSSLGEISISASLGRSSSPFSPLSLSLSSVSRKSRSAAISFIVQLVISVAITLLNTFNRQKIGSGSHRALSRRRRQGTPASLPSFALTPSLNLARENGVSYATVASGEYRCWRFGNSGTAARLGIQ